MCVISTNLTEIILLYRLIEFSTTAAMPVLALECLNIKTSAFQAVICLHSEKILKILIIQSAL